MPTYLAAYLHVDAQRSATSVNACPDIWPQFFPPYVSHHTWSNLSRPMSRYLSTYVPTYGHCCRGFPLNSLSVVLWNPSRRIPLDVCPPTCRHLPTIAAGRIGHESLSPVRLRHPSACRSQLCREGESEKPRHIQKLALGIEKGRTSMRYR